MTVFDDIRADAAAGTPGPWVQGGKLAHTSAFDHYDPFGPNGGSVACVVGEVEGDASEMDVANARRIARVPDLERLVLAAEVMAEALHKIANEPAKDADAEIIRVDRLACDAITAWKEAQ